MTPTEGRQDGEARAERGIKRAAHNHQWEIALDTVKFLDSLLSSPNETATLDDAVDDLSLNFGNTGKWRAAIPKRLKADGVIVAERVVKSSRPARHAGFATQWRLADRTGAERRRDQLNELIRSNLNRPPPGNDAGSTEIAEPFVIDFQI